MSVTHSSSFGAIRTVINCGWLQQILRVGVFDLPFCHIMRMLIRYCHGEVMRLMSVARASKI